MRALVTNDDGIQSEGLHLLAAANHGRRGLALSADLGDPPDWSTAARVATDSDTAPVPRSDAAALADGYVSLTALKPVCEDTSPDLEALTRS